MLKDEAVQLQALELFLQSGNLLVGSEPGERTLHGGRCGLGSGSLSLGGDGLSFGSDSRVGHRAAVVHRECFGPDAAGRLPGLSRRVRSRFGRG